MGFRIIWSDFAENQIDKIYLYYKNKVNISVASKLVKEIINAPQKLLKSPNIGQQEDLLNERDIKYRYIIFKNYKLIYSVDYENELIKITDVFDTRQNPVKIQRS